MKKMVSIKQIYTLFQKYGDLNIRVSTPDGPHHILGCDITEKNAQRIKFKTSGGKELISSPNHRVMADTGRFVYVKNLFPGRKIKTISGDESILSLEFLPDRTDLYDIEVNKVHQYYSNGILSHNSSTFDVLMFCLYDKTPRAFKAVNIMNNRKDDFACELNFEIDGVDYFIKREAVRNKKGDVKVDVMFWNIDDKGEIVSLNGEDRRDTDAIIRSYVGSYDDFILTNLSVQNQGTLFIDKSQSERKDLLSQFMGLTIFDKLYTSALDEMKEVSGALKRFNREDFSQNLVDIQAAIEALREQYTTADDELQTKKSESTGLGKKITKLYGDKIPLDIDKVDIKKLESHAEKLEIDFNDITESIAELTKKRSDLKSELKSAETKVEGYDSTLEVKHQELLKLSDDKKKLEYKLQSIKTEIRSYEDQLKKMGAYRYSEDCDFCIKNLESDQSDSVTIRSSLDKSKQSHDIVMTEILNLKNQLTRFDKVKEDYSNWQLDVALHNKLEKNLLKLEADLQHAMRNETSKSTELTTTKARIQKYYDSIETIKKNDGIQKQIDVFEDAQKILLSEIKTLDKAVRQTHGELEVKKASKQEILQSIKDAEELEETYYAYEYYTNAICRDGVPYELISKIIPSIESEINNILTQIVDFTVVLEVDGKNINGKIVYDVDKVWPLELSSGMERFISSLAIRVALTNISNLPKSTFLIADEGLGVLDADNLSSMYMMFSILKSHFDFIIVISHLEVVKDIVDNLIEIKQVNGGFSQIQVN